MIRDHVSADEVHNDPVTPDTFESIRERLVDECSSGENTDVVADMTEAQAKELLAEMWWFLHAPAAKVCEEPNTPLTEAMLVRLSEMRDRCRPYIEQYAAKEAGKQIEAPY